MAGTLPVDATLVIGLLASIAAFALFVCTAMIYASLKFLAEWHSALTVVNYTLLGLASGFMLAAAFSAYSGTGLLVFYGVWAVIFTTLALISRVASLMRNRRLRQRIDLKSAIGGHHSNMRQQTQGFTGGAFNTREFFHHKSADRISQVRYVFLLLVFPLPVLLIGAAYLTQSSLLPVTAFVVQYLGLIVERWYFFAEAQHPQNLYYQAVA